MSGFNVTSLKIGIGVGAVVIIAILAISIVTLIKVTKSDNNAIDYAVPFNSDPNRILNIYPKESLNTAKYQQAAKYFSQSIDTSVNPCDDFYQYACGKYHNDISFDIVEFAHYHNLADAYNIRNNSDVGFTSFKITIEISILAFTNRTNQTYVRAMHIR